ncbi:MAG: hypothetical protein RR425_02055 [Erysipelotrichales bacterium]
MKNKVLLVIFVLLVVINGWIIYDEMTNTQNMRVVIASLIPIAFTFYLLIKDSIYSHKD